MSTTHWTWTVVIDEPDTGKRMPIEGETISGPHATERSVMEGVFQDLDAELERRYGPGYRVEYLSPATRIQQR
ncbi:hypothetical protein [Streptomyces sp. NPDC001282]|uniref:hypothetical protein n=1 Tax=Streptomyces sp. NPDC001282 TaxID=3364557 RepID=UPI0036A72AB9